MNRHLEEYQLLINILEEIDSGLDGYCNDIDCDKYLYKDLLIKKYKPVLKHSFSCLEKLSNEKKAIMRLLSMDKFKKFRYKKCEVCRRILDELSKEYCIVSFTRKLDNGYHQLNAAHTHKKCAKKFKIPFGWSGF